jgi:DNA-binding Lrp family transcriptional regulator
MYKSLNGLDALILSRLVGGLPISEDPYRDIGRSFGLSAAEVLAVVRRLVEKGVVTRVGPFFNSFKMGHVSTLRSTRG